MCLLFSIFIIQPFVIEVMIRSTEHDKDGGGGRCGEEAKKNGQ